MKKEAKTVALKLFVLVSTIFLAGYIIAQVFTNKAPGNLRNIPIVNQHEEEQLSDETIGELTAVFMTIDTSSFLYMAGQYMLTEALSGKLIETQEFKLSKTTGGFYTRIGHIEQILEGKRSIVVDNYSRTITVNQNAGSEQPALGKAFADFGSFANNWKAAAIKVKKDGDTKTVAFQFDSTSFYKSGTIEYDQLTKRLISSSSIENIIIPGAEEDVQTSVVLKLAIQEYQPHNSEAFRNLRKVCELDKRGKIKVLAAEVKDYKVQYVN